MCHARGVSYNTVVWLPNALILTALLGALAVWRWRHKGAVSGLRWTGVAMLPLALYGIGLFRLTWTVGLAVSRFATGFVFRPSVWLGLILAVIAVTLIVVPGKLDRKLGDGPAKPTKQVRGGKARSSALSAEDDDMADIQEILKKHGLS